MDKVSAQDNKKVDELQKRLQQDFVVKNMPAFTSFSGASYEHAATPSGSVPKPSLNSAPAGKIDHKSAGIIIIGVGLLIVVALFYLAYRFVIKPAMNNSGLKQSPSVEQVVTPVVNEPVVPELVATATALTVVPVEAESSSTTPEVVPDLILPVIADADNDGLSDVAEVFLGTNPQLADTDNDNYSDKQEILAGYNPAGAGKLNDNGNLALFSDNQGVFAVIYPAAWEVNVANPKATLFSAPDQSFIQIAFEDAEQNYPDIITWYKSQFSDVDTLSQERLIESSFGPGILSADQQIAYFLDTDGRRVFVVSYIKSGETAPYLEIFKMMVASLMRLQ